MGQVVGNHVDDAVSQLPYRLGVHRQRVVLRQGLNLCTLSRIFHHVVLICLGVHPHTRFNAAGHDDKPVTSSHHSQTTKDAPMSEKPRYLASAAVWLVLLSLVLTPVTTLPEEHDRSARQALQRYLAGIAKHGKTRNAQGVWMQSAQSVLLHHRGDVPLPAASLTKVATTLAALRTWGPLHRFPTLIGAIGAINEGVLHGDLVVYGGGDPFFVWEDAIVLGNTLERAGIRRVVGRLLVVGRFYMNFVMEPAKAGGLLKQGLNAAALAQERQGAVSQPAQRHSQTARCHFRPCEGGESAGPDRRRSSATARCRCSTFSNA